MKPLLGIAAYEYRMSITRVGLLIVTGVFTLVYMYLGVQYGEFDHAARTDWWREAGQAAFSLSLFFPVLAGIVTADRAVRDDQLKVRELLRVTRLDDGQYIVGKYSGVSLSILTLQFGVVLLATTTQVVFHRLNPILIPYSLAASAVVHGPTILFITAFSLACPLIIPVRVYQILFTGYWYWGNFLNPEVTPLWQIRI